MTRVRACVVFIGYTGRSMRDRVHRVLDGFLGVLALLAVVSLVAEYGFDLPPEMEYALHRVDTGILVGFILQAMVRILMTTDRWTYIRQHRGEAIVTLLIFIYLVFPGLVERGVQAWAPGVAPGVLARVYIVISQVLVLFTAMVATVRASHRLLHMNIQPSLLLVLSFLFLILAGTGLLMLPRSTVSGGMHWIDALFTATSAVCVTGLVVVDTATYFTPLGQGVLLVLIQLGGLGIMTFTSFFALIGGAPRGLREYTTLRSLLGEENLARIRSTVIAIVLVTLICEILGAPGSTGWRPVLPSNHCSVSGTSGDSYLCGGHYRPQTPGRSTHAPGAARRTHRAAQPRPADGTHARRSGPRRTAS